MKTFFVLFLLSINSILFAGTIKTKTYTPGSNAIFNITSTIVYGEKDAYLIDAQFQKQYAEELVKEIKKLKKNLKIVYISHSDPDFYFGLDIIKKNFPEVKILSTSQTAFLIDASKDEKLNVWAPKLKNDTPTEIIIPDAVKKLPDLEGNKIEIKKYKNDPSHSFLWIPSLKTILGGISVSEKSHIWMADTQNKEAIDRWIEQISNMQELHPKKVIPSHFTIKNFSPENLKFIKEYLIEYKKATNIYKTADEIRKHMKQKYPNLKGEDNLDFGIKVFTGEIHWDLKNLYPAIEHNVSLDFGTSKQTLTIVDNKYLKNANDKSLEKISYTAKEIANNVFMVYWTNEEMDENIIQIQNFNNHTVYNNVYNKNGKDNHTQGKIIIN